MLSSFNRHFYLLCSLPDIGDFGSVPAVNKQELLTSVTESEGPVDIVRALLMSDDLLQRDSAIAGESEPNAADLTVFSPQQGRGEEPLPHFLSAEQKDSEEPSKNRITGNEVWKNYFQFVLRLARSTRSPFLQQWVGFEVGMRNALARARAAALDLDPEPYVVAQELADTDFPFESVVADWKASANPLKGLETLDKARWNWVSERERWYSFRDDEVAAYTLKIMILHRWRRMREGKNEPQ